MAGFETIRYDVADGIATLTLARPDKRNAMNERMFVEVADAAEQAGADAAVRAVVLTGDGPTFCAGIDLNELARFAGVKGSEFRTFVRLAQRPYLALSTIPKPVVAAVRNHAIGAGFQLALACDLRVASENARFAMLEPRYGIIPDLGGMHHLTRLVGPSLTKELVWSTRTVEADEALRIGLVNRVVPDDVLEKEAEALAREVTAHAPLPIALSKRLIDGATETSFEAELEREALAQALAIQSDDHREAVTAYFEKRPPRYSGA